MTGIGVAGCALIDYLYSGVDFSSPEFQTYQTRKPGDGGLRPGALVFASDLETFASTPLSEILRDVVGYRPADAANVGGPGIVAAIHAAQLGASHDIEVSFYGARGNDADGSLPVERLSGVPVSLAGYRAFPGPTPSTIVLSDPAYANGAGERCFINTIGAAAHYSPDEIETAFYENEVVLFGGTALVPTLHDRLDECVVKAHEAGAVTVIGTVYDFRNEQRSSNTPWPLLRNERSWRALDLLITDYEEALRISGTDSAHAAVDRFLSWGVGAAAVTCGTDPLVAESAGRQFQKSGRIELPISERIHNEHKSGINPTASAGRDTTGCGDNFVGGVLYATAHAFGEGELSGTDFRAILAHGVVAGGLASFHLGGTYTETRPGEKAALVQEYLADYLSQTGLGGYGIV
ncbi:MAG: carbohydrate kinase family protein [Spirochaetaceae bacterium]|nr:MAG: carbohydrate kinase family protein [Spirochaetaceae bacterium]